MSHLSETSDRHARIDFNESRSMADPFGNTQLLVMVLLMSEQKLNAIIPGAPRNTREYNV